MDAQSYGPRTGGGRATESGDTVKEQPYNLYRLITAMKQLPDLWRWLVLILAGTLVIFFLSLTLANRVAQAKVDVSAAKPTSSNKGATESGDKGTGRPNKDSNGDGDKGSLEDNEGHKDGWSHKGGDASGSGDG